MVHCKKCKYGRGFLCHREDKENPFTDENEGPVIYREANSAGKCKHYQKKPWLEINY